LNSIYDQNYDNAYHCNKDDDEFFFINPILIAECVRLEDHDREASQGKYCYPFSGRGVE